MVNSLMISWCREPESNRHGPFGPQDFKSYLDISEINAKSLKTSSYRGFPAVFPVCRKLHFLPDARCSVSRVSAKI